jgi:ribose-phosphate pyrophosphokinase
MMYFNLTDYRHRVYSDTMLDSIGPIAMITHQLDPTLSSQINYHLVKRRKEYVEAEPDLVNIAGFARDDYRINVNMDRYDSGEGKVTVEQSVRGHDVFLFTDVLNYGREYQRYGSTVTMSPDEHYQDLVRLVLTTRPTAARVNVIMPYLYEGRRYKRNGRESLDCAQMLQELFGLGIDNFITISRLSLRRPRSCPLCLTHFPISIFIRIISLSSARMKTASVAVFSMLQLCKCRWVSSIPIAISGV